VFKCAARLRSSATQERLECQRVAVVRLQRHAAADADLLAAGERLRIVLGRRKYFPSQIMAHAADAYDTAKAKRSAIE
jgi:hypothetical protein